MSWNNFLHEDNDMKDFQANFHNLIAFREFIMH
jgi:hypothetical protein